MTLMRMTQSAPPRQEHAKRSEQSGAARATRAPRAEAAQRAGGNLATMAERTEEGDSDGHREGEGGTGTATGASTTVAFPTATTIRGMATVIGFCLAEWNATKADASATQRREHGFWIRWNRTTGAYTKTASVMGAWRANNEGASVNIGSRPADDGDVFTVASFHTHTPTFYRSATDVGRGRPTGPSQSDYDWDGRDDVAGLVFDYAISVAPAGHPLDSNAVIYTAGTQRSR